MVFQPFFIITAQNSGITHLAITLMKQRLKDTFGIEVVRHGVKTAETGVVRESADRPYFKVVGKPVSVPDAAALAESDPYQFQWWALGPVGARPAEGRKGADKLPQPDTTN